MRAVVLLGVPQRTKAQIPLRRLPRNFPVTRVAGKFRGSRRLVTGKSLTWIMLLGSHGNVSDHPDNVEMV